MTKKETIEKVMHEYGKYGVESHLVELAYDLAIAMDVPNGAIYHGMRMILNDEFGIQDDSAAKASGKALFEHTIQEIKRSEPNVSEEEIAMSLDDIGLENIINKFDKMAFRSSDKVKNAVKNEMEKYIALSKSKMA